MKSVYIHSVASISAQNTFESESLLFDIKQLPEKKAEVMHPNYKETISANALRRMATGVKMGIAAAYKALKIANLQQPDAILTGTGMGCIEDTEKFLNTIIANDETHVTPTSFIQSTHNTVGSQIALSLQCKAYNNTYVHGALSFESALMDACLLLQQDEANHVLVGGVDELGTEFVDAVRLMEDCNPQGIKVPIGEGATFFVLSSQNQDKAVQLLDLESYSAIQQSSIVEKLMAFITRNQLNVSDIDVLMTGNNGDAFDVFYDEVALGFSEASQLAYKQLCGEYYTASAFGLFMAHVILKSQEIPMEMLQNAINKKPIKTILLYNQFKGRDHSFILLSI